MQTRKLCVSWISLSLLLTTMALQAKPSPTQSPAAPSLLIPTDLKPSDLVSILPKGKPFDGEHLEVYPACNVIVRNANAVKVYNLQTGKRQQQFRFSSVQSVTPSPHGQLAIGMDDSEVVVLDRRNGNTLDRFRFNTGSERQAVRFLDFSDDGRYLAAMSDKGESVIRDLQTKVTINSFNVEGMGWGAAFSQDEKRVFAGSVGQGLWSVGLAKPAKPVQLLPHQMRGEQRPRFFAPKRNRDNSLLLSVSYRFPQQAFVYDTDRPNQAPHVLPMLKHFIVGKWVAGTTDVLLSSEEKRAGRLLADASIWRQNDRGNYRKIPLMVPDGHDVEMLESVPDLQLVIGVISGLEPHLAFWSLKDGDFLGKTYLPKSFFMRGNVLEASIQAFYTEGTDVYLLLTNGALLRWDLSTLLH